MTEAQFFAVLIECLAQCDEERLQHHREFTHGLLMDWLYPHEGAESN